MAGRISNKFEARFLTAAVLIIDGCAVMVLSLTFGKIGFMVACSGVMGCCQVLFSNANQRNLANCCQQNEMGICMALVSMGRSTSLPLGTVTCIAALEALRNVVDTHVAVQITTAAFCVSIGGAVLVTLARGTESKLATTPADGSIEETAATNADQCKAHSEVGGVELSTLQLKIEQDVSIKPS